MGITSPRIRSLLRQADKVADDGKRAAAEKLYRQIIEEAPETAAAWAGLGNILRSPAEKQASYQQALEIDPENAIAKDGLAFLSGEVVIVNQNEVVAAIEETIDNDEAQGGLNSTLLEPVDLNVAAEDEVVTDAPDQLLSADEHDHLPDTAAEPGSVLYCANHPNRETHLRCNRCGKPICSSCAKRTPVGYRCPECIREQEDRFFNASPMDYIVTVIVTLPLSLIAGWIATFLGFWSIFLGAAAGTLIGRLAFRAAGRRRGRGMPQLVAGIVIIGAIIPMLPTIFLLFSTAGHFSFRIIFTGIYLVTAAGAAYYQMR